MPSGANSGGGAMAAQAPTHFFPCACLASEPWHLCPRHPLSYLWHCVLLCCLGRGLHLCWGPLRLQRCFRGASGATLDPNRGPAAEAQALVQSPPQYCRECPTLCCHNGVPFSCLPPTVWGPGWHRCPRPSIGHNNRRDSYCSTAWLVILHQNIFIKW